MNNMYESTYAIMKDLYEILTGSDPDMFQNKYELAIGLLNVVEDYEISEKTGKDPKNVTMNLYINGDDRYYTFSENITSGDFLEGSIKINGIIPGGTYRGFAIDNDIACVLTGANYNCQAVSLVKNGDKYVNK